MRERIGDYIQTASGRFWPAHPDPAEVDIYTIAHALSNLCRFGGHVLSFYSVAQHSVLCARKAPREYALDALLHDAAEAYLVDLPSPIKKLLPTYQVMESAIQAVIAAKFGTRYPIPECVHEIDNKMLVTEAAQLMPPCPSPWWQEPHWPKPFTLRIEPWEPERARWEFLDTFLRLRAGDIQAFQPLARAA